MLGQAHPGQGWEARRGLDLPARAQNSHGRGRLRSVRAAAPGAAVTAKVILLSSRQTWIEQAGAALRNLEAIAGGRNVTLREMADLDREEFSRLIEAPVNLGGSVSKDLVDLAGLRPIEEVLELPQ